MEEVLQHVPVGLHPGDPSPAGLGRSRDPVALARVAIDPEQFQPLLRIGLEGGDELELARIDAVGVAEARHMSGKRRIRCAGRGQGSGCDEPSCFAHIIEDQIGALLAAFAVPAATQDRLLNLWRHYQSRDVSMATTRIRLQRKLRRLKELYLEGDLTKKEFQDQKANVTDELAALPLEGNPDNDDGARLASYLSDVSRAWLVATPEERNKLARQLFLCVVVKNKTAVAVIPRPDVRPFFSLVAVKLDKKECTGGSDGGRSRRCVTYLLEPSSSQSHPSEIRWGCPGGPPTSRRALAS